MLGQKHLRPDGRRRFRKLASRQAERAKMLAVARSLLASIRAAATAQGCKFRPIRGTGWSIWGSIEFHLVELDFPILQKISRNWIFALAHETGHITDRLTGQANLCWSARASLAPRSLQARELAAWRAGARFIPLEWRTDYWLEARRCLASYDYVLPDRHFQATCLSSNVVCLTN